ncbi:MAG: response regulator, partial [bacterium]
MSEKMKKILMIEDDIFLRKIYRDKLTRAGFEFVEGINGEEGLSKVLSEKPDLVLLDLILPRKNGFDVLAEIKMNSEVKHTPVVILSNLA